MIDTKRLSQCPENELNDLYAVLLGPSTPHEAWATKTAESKRRWLIRYMKDRGISLQTQSRDQAARERFRVKMVARQRQAMADEYRRLGLTV